MFDERQHFDLFFGPGQYLFRGTLPSKAFTRPYSGVGVTPTSVDPIVATLFACRYRMDGPAVVWIAPKSEFRDRLDGPNALGFGYELAVNIDMAPPEFESRCLFGVSVDESLTILAQLAYRLPVRLPDIGALAQALTQSPRMLSEDIVRYVELCRRAT